MSTEQRSIPACLAADMRWGETFEVRFHITATTLADCYDTMTKLIKRMKLPRSRGRRRDLVLHITYAATSTAEDQERGEHQRELQLYAHGLHYPLLPGTPELFVA